MSQQYMYMIHKMYTPIFFTCLTYDNITETLNIDLGEVESKLVHLEDVCEKHDLSSNKLQHEYQLSLYRQRKNVELEQVKGKHHT